VPIRSVVFDVGETLMSDATFWSSWARWVGVPAHTLAGLVGAVTALGHNNVEALKLIDPDFDLEAARAAREATEGYQESITDEDLYPDVRIALRALQEAGFWVGIVGNQTARAAELLRALELPADAIATSGEWNVAKPAAAFFDKVAQWAPGERDQIVYVGDHLYNDVLPAKSAGLRAAHVRRGQWGYLYAPLAGAAADWQVDSLAQLPDLLRAP
jgi:HAD superfamily hydrolase (TIGR01549 family)